MLHFIHRFPVPSFITMHLWECVFRFSCRLNDLPHCSQAYGFSPVWVLIWLIKFRWLVNDLSHCSHLCDFVVASSVSFFEEIYHTTLSPTKKWFIIISITLIIVHHLCQYCGFKILERLEQVTWSKIELAQVNTICAYWCFPNVHGAWVQPGKWKSSEQKWKPAQVIITHKMFIITTFHLRSYIK